MKKIAQRSQLNQVPSLASQPASTRRTLRLRPNRACRARQGGAVVEFAVCLPVLVMLILGSIEASSAIFLKQSLTAAAYEGIREATRLKSTLDSINSVTNNVLSARQVKGTSVQFTPADPSKAKRGDRIVVEVSASIAANSPFIGAVLKDRRLVTRSVMVKE